MNASQCDYCGRFAANPGRAQRSLSSMTVLPDGWWQVGAYQHESGEGAESEIAGEFCSRECISGHFAKPSAA